MIHKMGRLLRHEAATATGAEAATLARKSHQAVMAAAAAMDTSKTSFEHAAIEIRPKLLRDKVRQ